ncbi:UDP-glucose:undecaprenyl-phosphate glucose-1-phosphate transferase [Stieleria bergensis]|uniref:UDP-glucose:undecaprenyl-phosphate glucose-1-phosphate transferase n=1 Tax=Stieleria bergensis TaxID=2528025 RepID=A0A517STW3_9BACT|nr:UDP-glucose:undecaprenyl-phosphate glucose-1-phosphate transferase [Planctomycetes bacterium SV_7m_r]
MSTLSKPTHSKQAPSIWTERRLLDLLQPAIDSLTIFASLWLVRWCVVGVFDQQTAILGLATICGYLFSSQITGLRHANTLHSADREITTIAWSWSLTVVILCVLAFLTRYAEPFARRNLLLWLLLAPSMMAFGRMLFRIVMASRYKRNFGVRRVAIAGMNVLGKQTALNLQNNPTLGMQLVGAFDDRNPLRTIKESDQTPSDTNDRSPTGLAQSQAPDQYHLVGTLEEMVSRCKAGQIDTVLVTLPMRAEERIRYVLDQLSDTTASVYIVPDFYVFELQHSQWTNLGGIPAVSVFENPFFGMDGASKRICDLLLGSFALILAALPMTLIAIAIKLTSKGPIIFRQKRYGLDGKEIDVWKFRSMSTCDNGPVIKQATKHDARITPLGNILRKTSLDELPQLFNVVQGTMSLVGPRPHATAHNEAYRSLIQGYMLRHKVKPGITGLAQVNGCRGETDTLDKMEARVHWDHQYIRNWTLLMDIRILVKTLRVAWKQETAY